MMLTTAPLDLREQLMEIDGIRESRAEPRAGSDVRRQALIGERDALRDTVLEAIRTIVAGNLDVVQHFFALGALDPKATHADIGDGCRNDEVAAAAVDLPMEIGGTR